MRYHVTQIKTAENHATKKKKAPTVLQVGSNCPFLGILALVSTSLFFADNAE